MDFNQVRYYLALADTLNFTRAAERCHVTQPALTQGIKRLEEELGGELVRRDGRYTELTELGRGLRTHFERINRTRHLVGMTAKAIVSGDVAELNIGVMCTVGPKVVGAMLNDFQMHHPMTSIVLHDVTPTAYPNLLLTGSLDAVFCARKSSGHNRLLYTKLFDEDMVAAFPKGHELSQKEEVKLEDMLSYPYVDRLYCEFKQVTYDLAQERETPMNVVFRSEREDWVQSLIYKGAGVSVIPRYSLLDSGLDFRPLIDPKQTRSVELAIIDDREVSPALENLLVASIDHDWPSNI